MSNKLPKPSGIYNYARLVNSQTKYGKRMDRLSKAIFTEVVRPTELTNFKVVNEFAARPKDLRGDIVDYYYPRLLETQKLMRILRDHGLYRDEHQDFVDEMERLRVLRGKGKRRPRKPKEE